MAIPDGVVLIYHPEKKSIKVESRTLVLCKDCKFFEYDHPYIIQGIPILGHEVCNAWGDGCKTDENGWCFLGERKINNG